MELYYGEYKFMDELDEKGWRNSLFIVYDTSTPDGKALQDALDAEDECESLDELLWETYKVNDDDIVVYFDRNGIDAESVVSEIQRSHDIVLNSFERADKSSKENDFVEEILKWVGKTYGSQEMDNPSWNVRALAHYLSERGL